MSTVQLDQGFGAAEAARVRSCPTTVHTTRSAKRGACLVFAAASCKRRRRSPPAPFFRRSSAKVKATLRRMRFPDAFAGSQKCLDSSTTDGPQASGGPCTIATSWRGSARHFLRRRSAERSPGRLKRPGYPIHRRRSCLLDCRRGVSAPERGTARRRRKAPWSGAWNVAVIYAAPAPGDRPDPSCGIARTYAPATTGFRLCLQPVHRDCRIDNRQHCCRTQGSTRQPNKGTRRPGLVIPLP